MANGKSGDHPLTDILFNKLQVFSPSIDALIREIVQLGGEKALEKKFNLFAPPPLGVFERELKAMRDHLKQEAKARGWEI